MSLNEPGVVTIWSQSFAQRRPRPWELSKDGFGLLAFSPFWPVFPKPNVDHGVEHPVDRGRNQQGYFA